MTDIQQACIGPTLYKANGGFKIGTAFHRALDSRLRENLESHGQHVIGNADDVVHLSNLAHELTNKRNFLAWPLLNGWYRFQLVHPDSETSVKLAEAKKRWLNNPSGENAYALGAFGNDPFMQTVHIRSDQSLIMIEDVLSGHKIIQSLTFENQVCISHAVHIGNSFQEGLFLNGDLNSEEYAKFADEISNGNPAFKERIISHVNELEPLDKIDQILKNRGFARSLPDTYQILRDILKKVFPDKADRDDHVAQMTKRTFEVNYELSLSGKDFQRLRLNYATNKKRDRNNAAFTVSFKQIRITIGLKDISNSGKLKPIDIGIRVVPGDDEDQNQDRSMPDPSGYGEVIPRREHSRSPVLIG